jgi:hypothetical protein
VPEMLAVVAADAERLGIAHASTCWVRRRRPAAAAKRNSSWSATG